MLSIYPLSGHSKKIMLYQASQNDNNHMRDFLYIHFILQA